MLDRAERTTKIGCAHFQEALSCDCGCLQTVSDKDFVEANRQQVVGFFSRRIGDRALAEDLCQDCFAIVLVRLRQGTIADTTRLRAFLWGTVRRVLYAYRRESDRYLAQGGLEDMEPMMGSTMVDSDRADVQEMVASVLNRLSEPRDRDLLVRRYLLEQEPITIQRDLNLTPGTFKVALHRARRRMRSLLDQYRP